MLRFIQLILLPISLLYELVLRMRNHLYDIKLVAPTRFDVPTICVGNLAFGGTGKTPHIEYLISKLKAEHQIAVLSRGYGRKTQGYVFAGEASNALLLGDEPFQLFLGNPEVAVGVCENRVIGIPNLLFDAPQTNLILLDDAYQHRQLECGLNILLTDFERPYFKDFLFPSGYLREYRAAAKRANIVIVTKCPADLSQGTAESITQALKLLPHQKVFFSSMVYSEPQLLFGSNQNLHHETKILAFASIAKPEPFYQHLKSQFSQVKSKTYADHHLLTEREMLDLKERYDLLGEGAKAIVTTSKDASKLLSQELPDYFKSLPIYTLAITPMILFDKESALLSLIKDAISDMQKDNYSL